MRAYFALSFALMAVLGATLALSNWTILERMAIDMPWRALLIMPFVLVGVWGAWMVFVAIFAGYRR